MEVQLFDLPPKGQRVRRRGGADLCDDEDGYDVVSFLRALQGDDCLPQDGLDLTVVVGHGPVRWRKPAQEP